MSGLKGRVFINRQMILVKPSLVREHPGGGRVQGSMGSPDMGESNSKLGAWVSLPNVPAMTDSLPKC